MRQNEKGTFKLKLMERRKKLEDKSCSHPLFILKEIRYINGEPIFRCLCIENQCEREFTSYDNNICAIANPNLYQNNDLYNLVDNARLLNIDKEVFGITQDDEIDKNLLFKLYYDVIHFEWSRLKHSMDEDELIRMFPRHFSALSHLGVKVKTMQKE